ncbi:7-cyano-7-deazaguanine synthase [Acinetobacter pittii]|nr:7-cyano-7-deazaguanine synthase [Acinetobacter pittii]
MESMKKCLLLSGGIDSFCLAFLQKPDIAITIDYGQSAAEAEIRSSEFVCKKLGIIHEIIKVDCSHLGMGDLSNNPMSKYNEFSDWWPYRNQLLITLCAMKAIQLNINEIMIASVANDSSHIDGSQRFIDCIDNLISLQEGNLRITAPVNHLTTAELIKASKVNLNVLKSWSHSCHKANYPCGKCRGCYKHYESLELAENLM